MSQDCILCKLISGEFEVTKVYEDDMVMAAMDIQPVNAGHVLIFPKEHQTLVKDLSDDLAAHLFVVGKKVSAALRNSGLPCEGVNFFIADGETAGQEIAHCHLHVFPRFDKDGFGLKFPEGYTALPERSVLEEVAEKIKKVL